MRRALEFLDKDVLGSLLAGGIWTYQVSLGVLLRGACRFEPSCSRYAAEAIRRHGGVRGSRLAVGRLLRCHPLRPGGFDPVP